MFCKILLILTLINKLPSAVSGPENISNYKEASDSNFSSLLTNAKKSLVVLRFSSYAPGQGMDEHFKYIVIKHPTVVFMSVNIGRCGAIVTNYGVGSSTFIVLVPHDNEKHKEVFRHVKDNESKKNDYAIVDKVLQGFEDKIQRADSDNEVEGRLFLAKDKVVLLLFPVIFYHNEAFYTSSLESISKVFPNVVIIIANLTLCLGSVIRYKANRNITILAIISGGIETTIRGYAEQDIINQLTKVVSLQSEYSSSILPSNLRVSANDNDFRSILAIAPPTSVVFLQFFSSTNYSGKHMEFNDKYFVNNHPNILFISVNVVNCRKKPFEYGLDEYPTYILLIPQKNKEHAVFSKRIDKRRDSSLQYGFAILQNDLDDLTARHQEPNCNDLEGRLILAVDKIVLLVFSVNFKRDKPYFDAISDNYLMVVIIRMSVSKCPTLASNYDASRERTTCIFIRNGLTYSTIKGDDTSTIEKELDKLIKIK